MGDFGALLGELAEACRELEQIKVEAAGEQRRACESFEEASLSMLRQEQNVLHRVEEESAALRQRLDTIRQGNAQALHNAAAEINAMVVEITGVSAQLRAALENPRHAPAATEIQKRVGAIFVRKRALCLALKKVRFLPCPLPACALGDIACDELPPGLANGKTPANTSPAPLLSEKKLPGLANGNAAPNASPSPLLSEEKPPWDVKDYGVLGAEILLEDESDSDESASSWGDPAPALTPQQATQKWLYEIEPKPGSRPLGADLLLKDLPTTIRTNQGAGQHSRLLKDPPTNSRTNQQAGPQSRLLKDPPTNSWTNQEAAQHSRLLKDPPTNSHTNQRAAQHSRLLKDPPTNSQTNQRAGQHSRLLKDPPTNSWTNHGAEKHSRLLKDPPTNSQTNQGAAQHSSPTGANPLLQDPPTTIWTNQGLRRISAGLSPDLGPETSGTPNPEPAEANTVFRASSAYIRESQSESSDDTIEEELEAMGDPGACRQVALRGSRVPSAKKRGDGERQMSWMEPTNEEPASWMEPTNEEPATSANQELDYLRMSHDGATSPADSVSSSFTFIIDAPEGRGVSRTGTFRVSETRGNAPAKPRPVISDRKPVPRSSSIDRLSRPRTAPAEDRRDSASSSWSNPRGPRVTRQVTKPSQRSLSRSAYNLRERPPEPRPVISKRKPVPRSCSIDRLSRPRSAPAKERRDSASSASSSWSNPRGPQHARRVSKPFQRSLCGSTCDLREERGGAVMPARQLGKFGSGRAELNLPHGLHVTPAGALYIVDYGNKRLQVMDTGGQPLQQLSLRPKNYFDVAVSNRGLVALTNSSDRSVEVYNRHGRLLRVIGGNWGAPRGITANHRGEFIVADTKAGALRVLVLDTPTGRPIESTVLPGFSKPYLVATNLQGRQDSNLQGRLDSNLQGLLAVSERGPDGGCCVKVLGGDWQLLRVLGLRGSPGPPLTNPWGVCVASDGGVLVSDWGQKHSIVYYPANGVARLLVTEGLSSPRGLALWQDALLLVADSMHSCIKAFQLPPLGQ